MTVAQFQIEIEATKTCPKCGAEMDWVDCPELGCEGGQITDETLMEEDPLWYSEGDSETCSTCDGAGGWWECPNAESHYKESNLPPDSTVDIPY